MDDRGMSGKKNKLTDMGWMIVLRYRLINGRMDGWREGRTEGEGMNGWMNG